MKENYLSLVGRIRQELLEIQVVVQRINDIWQQATRSSDDYYIDATALNLHRFYAGIERVLEMIADTVDRTKPGGANWHQELLRQMAAEIPSVRPAVLSLQTRNALDRYRGFRHVVRNVYTFNLDPIQIAPLIQQLAPTMNAVANEFSQFADWLEQLGNGS